MKLAITQKVYARLAVPRVVDVWRVLGVNVVQVGDGTWLDVSDNELLKIGRFKKRLLERANFIPVWSQRELTDFVNARLYKQRQVIEDLPTADNLLPVVGKVIAGIRMGRVPGSGDEWDYAVLVRPDEFTTWLHGIWSEKHQLEREAFDAFMRTKNLTVLSHGCYELTGLPIANLLSAMDVPPVLIKALKDIGYRFEFEDGRLIWIEGGIEPIPLRK